VTEEAPSVPARVAITMELLLRGFQRQSGVEKFNLQLVVSQQLFEITQQNKNFIDIHVLHTTMHIIFVKI
jgi:hypothetical protein